MLSFNEPTNGFFSASLPSSSLFKPSAEKVLYHSMDPTESSEASQLNSTPQQHSYSPQLGRPTAHPRGRRRRVQRPVDRVRSGPQTLTLNQRNLEEDSGYEASPSSVTAVRSFNFDLDTNDIHMSQGLFSVSAASVFAGEDTDSDSSVDQVQSHAVTRPININPGRQTMNITLPMSQRPNHRRVSIQGFPFANVTPPTPQPQVTVRRNVSTQTSRDNDQGASRPEMVTLRVPAHGRLGHRPRSATAPPLPDLVPASARHRSMSVSALQSREYQELGVRLRSLSDNFEMQRDGEAEPLYRYVASSLAQFYRFAFPARPNLDLNLRPTHYPSVQNIVLLQSAPLEDLVATCLIRLFGAVFNLVTQRDRQDRRPPNGH